MRPCIFIVLLCFSFYAQVQQAPVQVSTTAPDAQQLVTKEFGKSFTVVPGFAPLFGDIDNDGQEDAVVVVMSPTPLVDEVEYKYRGIDPYSAYWGWANPRETVQFSATSVGPILYIAVIHNWRAPKAKFLIINLPFQKLALSRVALKKKAISSIHAVETGGLESDVFWDGKKYKWEPAYTNQ
jgi:hypothetical protein